MGSDDDLRGLMRRIQEEENVQPPLFEGIDNRWWIEHWWGMPTFEMQNARPTHRITMNFMTYEDVLEFGRRLGIELTKRTDSAWFPPEVVDAPSEWEYGDEP